MNILHLTLKKQWFDMIASGEKKEEYREIKGYWLKRLYFNDNDESYNQNMIDEVIDELQNSELTNQDLHYWAGWKDHSFGKIKFTHGYAKNAPSFEIECLGIEIGEAKPEWSDNWHGKVFVIKLGKIITA